MPQLHENILFTVFPSRVIGIVKVPASAEIVAPEPTAKVILADDFVTVIPFAEGTLPIMKSVLFV